MAHKCLVSGTAYDITGGKCLVGGTAYSITGGKTLVGGTAYDISFVKATFEELMADASIVNIVGRNASSESYVTVSTRILQSDTYYLFQFWGGHLSIVKIAVTYIDANTEPILTTTDLAASVAMHPYIRANVSTSRISLSCSVSSNGTEASTAINGATIALVQFPNYPNSVVDKVISQITLTQKAGRDMPSTALVHATFSASDRWFVAWSSYFAYNSPIGTVVFSNYTTNPSLMRTINGEGYISTNGTSNTSVYGGSIVAVTE